MKVNDFDGDNFEDGDDMGYLEILSSEDDNPNEKSPLEAMDIIVPSVGMKFKNEEEVFEFYKNYAYQIGFPVRKRNSKKGTNGVVRYVTFTCSQNGHRTGGANKVLKPQPTIQTRLKARLMACSDINGIWRINTVHLEHNHKTSLSKSRLY
ncbi:Hypothetical predicted protein [Olea europaea subsp. europaea]|uniref:FAR1 domain-containing protein n=1 Tax=Olea europaea subsp. europaea TaxID=158383 RepID=A0A8S0UXX5_OLEEU|nr:Hypothetical predicted protein [Olea europaea subsp. europaea]